ncbi:MAG: hypothetical protein JWN09_2305 [Microbacteriaceae bacterium]|nr:hypothetical protein [Microbacteriaceae bacterium]
MANHDDAGDGDLAGAPYAPPGSVRSTFTPLTGGESTPEPTDTSSEAENYDDDDLADALVAEAIRLGYTGAIRIVEQDEAASPIPLSQLPAPAGPPIVFAADAPSPSGFANRAADEVSPSVPAPGNAPSFPIPPQRRSLPDQALVRSLSDESLEPDGISSVFEKFQVHLRLREQEVREYREWEDTMQAIGTPEALKSIEEVKTDFIEVIPAATPTAPTLTAPRQTGPLARQLVRPPDTEGPAADEPILEEHVVEEPVVEVPPSSNPRRPVVPQPLRSRFAPQPNEAADFDSLLGGGIEDEVAVGAPAAVSSGPPAAADEASPRQSIFSFEDSGLEPTPLDRRVGRSTRLFWLWFATNSSVLGVAFGATLFSLGMSLRQAIVSAFIGVAISFVPLGLGTLAGKWSGQPTMVVSRATFGLVGNVVPASLAVIVRLFWGAVLLWMIAASTARVLGTAKLAGPFSQQQLTVIAMAVGFVIALLVAFLGYGLFARVQLILTIVSGILLVGFIALTWPSVSISNALTVGDGPWILVVTGAVLVFSFVGLAWATGSADLARYQRPSGSGASSMLWASFGSTLPAFLLVAYGSLLAASDPTMAKELVTTPLDAVAHLLPGWYPVPLIAGVVLSLLSGVILSIYSGGFALQSAGLRLPRSWTTVLVAAVLFAVALVMTFTVDNVVPLFRDCATTLAVPVAAWVGIFAAEMMIRRRFDAKSLLGRGGVYPAVNWVNLVMLVVASAIGLGLTTATIGWLGWEGYLLAAFGVSPMSQLAGTDFGVLVALLLGLLTPLAAGIPAVRRQELARA